MSKQYKLSVKASTKGAVSIYGLGRFPVTLYADQWDAIFASCDSLKAWIEKHRAELKGKPDSNGGPAGADVL
jgi:hypothetical protein